jgi:hypothetical protein
MSAQQSTGAGQPALTSLRDALAAAVEALLHALDVLDGEIEGSGIGDPEALDSDGEPDSDHEPSLGATPRHEPDPRLDEA